MNLFIVVLSETAVKMDTLVWIVPIVIPTGDFDYTHLDTVAGAMYDGDPPRFSPFLALIRDGENYFVIYRKRNDYGHPAPIIHHFGFTEIPSDVHACAFKATEKLLHTHQKHLRLIVLLSHSAR
jgi:hypothetical protein